MQCYECVRPTLQKGTFFTNLIKVMFQTYHVTKGWLPKGRCTPPNNAQSRVPTHIRGVRQHPRVTPCLANAQDVRMARIPCVG